MKTVFIIMMLLLPNNAYQIKAVNKKFPKVSYTKIHDISYRSPIRNRRMQPFAFKLVKEIRDTINNYINETYAMASFPLSYNFANLFNVTKFNVSYV
tara:strand:+ start:733 stop:1023 length:291 start_codon:yes stop_codon:yes gene_type:complete